MRKYKQSGFTLLEILLVVAAIAILAAVVVVAINPAKQLADTRQAERRSELNAILNAVWQEAIDNNGTLNSNASTTEQEICACGSDNNAVGGCTGASFADLCSLVPTYLSEMPEDPNKDTSQADCTDTATSTCYTVQKTSNGRITIRAPRAETDGPSGSTTTLEFTR